MTQDTSPEAVEPAVEPSDTERASLPSTTLHYLEYLEGSHDAISARLAKVEAERYEAYVRGYHDCQQKGITEGRLVIEDSPELVLLRAERDALLSVLEGAEYKIDLEWLKNHGREGGYALGVEVANRTKQICSERDELKAKLAVAVEALNDIADGMGELTHREIGRFSPAVARSALATLTSDTPKEGKDDE